jgi:hypothetical protein
MTPAEEKSPRVWIAITCAVAVVVVVVSVGYLGIARDDMARFMLLASVSMEAVLLVAIAAAGPRVLRAPPRLRLLMLLYALLFFGISGLAIFGKYIPLIRPLRYHERPPFGCCPVAVPAERYG